MKRTKASFTSSPLGEPETYIHTLAAKFQEKMYLPDPTPLYVVLGSIAGTMLSGGPVWMMLVGPSSCGKTELLMSVLKLPRLHMLVDITGDGAFLSGVSKKDLEKGATGGMLRVVGKRGGFIIEDFTSSVMSKPVVPRDQITTALRSIANGFWLRSIGGGGGRTLKWKGKISIVAGGTAIIDQQRENNAALGERWLYYRFTESDGYGQSLKAARNVLPDTDRAELQDAVQEFFEAMQLDWILPCDEGEVPCVTEHDHDVVERQSRDLTDGELNRLVCIAELSCLMRNFPLRDFKQIEIIDVPGRSELAPRMTKALGQLYRGLELIGLGEDERWEIIGKVALDSVPALRAEIVRVLRKSDMKIAELRKKVRVGVRTVQRAVEDLEIYGVIELTKDGEVRLTEKTQKQLRIGWGKRR